jgi:methanogenic corrinoid protein MtbC1
VLLAAPTAELHVVALRMTGDLLRDAGYDVVMLGADVPAPALAVSATRHRPDVICMSSTMPGGGDQLLISMDEVQRTWPRAGFVLGGRSLTSRLRSLPGVEICGRVTDAVEAVDALVKRAATN